MPERGKLTKPDQVIINAWFKEKYPEGMRCSCAKPEADWVLGESVVASPTFTGGFNLGGSVYPQIQLMCSNCGYTRYFNAIYVGILKTETDSSPQEQEERNAKQTS